ALQHSPARLRLGGRAGPPSTWTPPPGRFGGARLRPASTMPPASDRDQAHSLHIRCTLANVPVARGVDVPAPETAPFPPGAPPRPAGRRAAAHSPPRSCADACRRASAPPAWVTGRPADWLTVAGRTLSRPNWSYGRGRAASGARC